MFAMSSSSPPNRIPVKDRQPARLEGLEKLLGLAKLASPLKTAAGADPVLQSNWLLVRDWSEEMRYHRINKAEAEALYTAIADGAHGVLPWIKTQR